MLHELGDAPAGGRGGDPTFLLACPWATWPPHSEPKSVDGDVLGATGSIGQQPTVADMPDRIDRVPVHTRKPGDFPAGWADRVPGGAWVLRLLGIGPPVRSKSRAACADAVNAMGVGGLRVAT